MDRVAASVTPARIRVILRIDGVSSMSAAISLIAARVVLWQGALRPTCMMII
jgi:hypothetical protein